MSRKPTATYTQQFNIEMYPLLKEANMRKFTKKQWIWLATYRLVKLRRVRAEYKATLEELSKVLGE